MSGQFPETAFRQEHRYRALLGQLGISPETMDGTAPDEADRIMRAAIERKAAEVAAARSDEQKLMEEPITVILGGKIFEVRPARIRDDKQWRKHAAVILERMQGALVDLVASGTLEERGPASAKATAGEPDASDPATPGQAARSAELGRNIGVVRALAALTPWMFGEGYDEGKEMLFAYSPALAAKRDEIEDTASGPELVRAIMQVLEAFVLPFAAAVMRETMGAMTRIGRAG